MVIQAPIKTRHMDGSTFCGRKSSIYGYQGWTWPAEAALGGVMATLVAGGVRGGGGVWARLGVGEGGGLPANLLVGSGKVAA